MAATEQSNQRIEAIVISYKEGFTIYHNVKMIRLKGNDINLLIMVDFMPTVGEISGRVEILCEEAEEMKGRFNGSTGEASDTNLSEKCIVLDQVNGFFVIKNNVFKLLLREDCYDQ